MDTKQTEKPISVEAAGALAALQRAADRARRIAIETNTAIIVFKDGKCVRITADELRQQENK